MCSLIAGLTALGGALQYRSQQQAAKQQEAAYRAQADAAEQNARIESKKQEQIADNYARQANQLRARQRLAEGAQRAETGAAGLGFSGSAMDILSSGLSAYQQDQEDSLWNQRNDNYNSRVAQTNYLTQAANARTAAGNVKRAARWQGIGTILGTAASIYGLNTTPGGSTGTEPSKESAPSWSVTSDMGHGYSLTTTASNSFISSNKRNPFAPKTFFSQSGKSPYNFENVGW